MGLVLKPDVDPPKLNEFCHLSHDAQRVMAAMYEDYSTKKQALDKAKRPQFDPRNYYQSLYASRFGPNSSLVQNDASDTPAQDDYGSKACNPHKNNKMTCVMIESDACFNQSVVRRLNFEQQFTFEKYHGAQDCRTDSSVTDKTASSLDCRRMSHADSVTDENQISSRYNCMTEHQSVHVDVTSTSSDSPPIETQDYQLLSQMPSSEDTVVSWSGGDQQTADTPSVAALTHLNKDCYPGGAAVPSSPSLFSQESVFLKPSKQSKKVSKSSINRQSVHHDKRKVLDGVKDGNGMIINENIAVQKTSKHADCDNYDVSENHHVSKANNDIWKQSPSGNIETTDTDNDALIHLFPREKGNDRHTSCNLKNTVELVNTVGSHQIQHVNSQSLAMEGDNISCTMLAPSKVASQEDLPNFQIGCGDLSFVFNPVIGCDDAKLCGSIETVQSLDTELSSSVIPGIIDTVRKSIDSADNDISHRSVSAAGNCCLNQFDKAATGILLEAPQLSKRNNEAASASIQATVGPSRLCNKLTCTSSAAGPDNSHNYKESSLTEESPFPLTDRPLYPIFCKKDERRMQESPLLDKPLKQGKKRVTAEKGFVVPFKKQKASLYKRKDNTCGQSDLVYMSDVSMDSMKNILEQVLRSEEVILVAVYADKSTQLRDTLFAPDNKKRISSRAQACCMMVNVAMMVPQNADMFVYMFPVGTEGDTLHQSIFRKFWSRLLSSGARKIGFQVKDIFKELMKTCSFSYNNVDTSWSILDTAVAAWLLEPDNPISTFHDLLNSLHMPEQAASDCSVSALREDMMLLSCAMATLFKKLISKGLWDLFFCVETKLTPLLAAMEMRQLSIATHTLLQFSEILKMKLNKLEQEAHQAAGHTFLLSSHAQLRQVLCEELRLDSKLPQSTRLARTSVSREMSTSEAVLTQLFPFHPLPGIVLEHRQLLKLKSTYIDGMLSCVRDGGLTSHWDQTAGATGRLTSHHPNLQAIPKLPVTLKGYTQSYIVDRPDVDEVTVYARDTFISPVGWSLLAADFQQIELRLLAHLTEDPVLLDLFSDSSIPDIFNALTAQWLGKKVEGVTTAEREQTKRVVYSVMYGAGKEKLAEYLKISADNAKAIIDSFLLKFPAVNTFTKACVDYCRKHGYTCSVFQRRRLFPNIHHRSPVLRAQAERQCVNFRVQGSAADLCKAAMLQVEDALSRQPNIHARLLVQIHDELLLEVLDSDLSLVTALVKDVMECQEKLCGSMVKLKIPIPVSLSVGKKWGHMEPL